MIFQSLEDERDDLLRKNEDLESKWTKLSRKLADTSVDDEFQDVVVRMKFIIDNYSSEQNKSLKAITDLSERITHLKQCIGDCEKDIFHIFSRVVLMK